MASVVARPDDWYEVTVPILQPRGELSLGKIHFGQDFAFGLTSHVINDSELAASLNKTRRKFVEMNGADKIIEQLKETRARLDIPRRIGRLLHENPQIEANVRERLAAYAEGNKVLSKSESEYIITQNLRIDQLYELYTSISENSQPISLVDSRLLAFLGEYSPTYVEQINNSQGTDYPLNPANLRTEKGVRVAMAHNSLDNLLFEGRATAKLLLDRITRFTEVAEYLGLPTDDLKKYAEEIEKIPPAQAVYFLKKMAFHLYSLLANQSESTLRLTRSENIYPFVGALKELFGENLQNIILYGSSVNKKPGNDFDLLVIVDSITEELYEKLQTKQKEINQHSDRDVQMIIVPRENLQPFLAIEGMPFGSIELIQGSDMEIPVFSENNVQRAAYMANRIIRSLGSMQMTFREPEQYFGKTTCPSCPFKNK